jgi:predicted permease
MIEGIVLAVAGAAIGIVIGYFGLVLLKAVLPPAFSALQSAQLDFRVLGAISVITMSASIAFGFYPAMRAGRIDIRTAQSGRGIVGAGRSYARPVLSVLQIAFAVAVLISAGLLGRSFQYLYGLTPGFDADHVVTANFSLLDARYSAPAAANRYFNDVLQRLQAIPGVEAAAVAQSMPYERGMNTVFLKPGETSDSYKLTNLAYVSPDFFKALRIPLLKGRRITEADTRDSTPVVVINQGLANMYFKNTDPIGTEIRMGSQRFQIVGVVGDVLQQAGWGQYGPMGRIPGMYMPAAQSDRLRASSPSWVVRTAGAPEAAQKQIQAAVEPVDPLLPVASFRTFEQIHLRSLALERFRAMLLGIAAGLALLLAGIGTYAMISNLVTERTRELGIRLALGAATRQAVVNAIAPAFFCAGAGVTIGAILARNSAKFLEGMLYGVTAVDSATYLSVAGSVGLIVLIASLVPAWWITQLDPAQTLRLE